MRQAPRSSRSSGPNSVPAPLEPQNQVLCANDNARGDTGLLAQTFTTVDLTCFASGTCAIRTSELDDIGTMEQPEAVAVLEAAIQQVQARAKQALQGQQQRKDAGGPAFIPSSRFDGRKPGYFFSRGVRGVG